MLPVTINLSMAQGSTSGFSFILQNEKNQELDFTGFEPVAKARFLGGNSDVYELQAEVNIGNVLIYPKIPNVLPAGRYAWDVRLTNSEGQNMPIATGILEVKRSS